MPLLFIHCFLLLLFFLLFACSLVSRVLSFFYDVQVRGWWSRCLTRPLILSLFVSVFCPAVLLSAQWIVSCTRITCIQPLTRFSLTFLASPFFEESGFCLFVVPLFFSFSPFLSHHVFFLFYWPFRTRLIACLVRAAVLPLSFCLHLFISRCFVIGSSD